MYQLIAFDMDGTLLGSDKQISPGNRRAIAAAARAGKTVILNTGRCRSELEEYLGLIPEVRYLNCASGALVYDLKEKRTLYSSLLSVEMCIRDRCWSPCRLREIHAAPPAAFPSGGPACTT